MRPRRLLLTALLAVGLTGPLALVGRASGPPPPSAWKARVVGYLTTPDGAQLRYSVLLPATTGRFPVLLNYSGYDAGSIGGPAYKSGNTWMETALDDRLLRAGYAIVGLSMRGTGCSTGTFDLFGPHWGPDGALAVEWAARQSWSTGHVGMYLWSFPGITQLSVAATRPPHLDAIAPGMVVTDPLRDVGAPGGVPNPQFVNLWWATIMASWQYVATSAEAERDGICLRHLARNYAVGQASSPTADSYHVFEGPYWAHRDLRSATARITIPVLSVADWQDEEVGSRGGYYQDLLNPDSTWYVGMNGEHDIYVSRRFGDTLLAFFDHFLKSAANGFGESPHVQLWQDTTSPGGAQSSDAQLEAAVPSWVMTAPRWPLPVAARTFYLGGSGELGAQPQPAGLSTSLVPVPGPAVNVDLLSAIAGDSGGPVGETPWTKAQPVPGGARTFTSKRFREPLTLAGSASLNLWMSATAPDTDLQVTVTDVRSDGKEEYLQRGWLRASDRALDRALSTPLRPVHLQSLAGIAALPISTPVPIRLEIPPFSHTFRAGSALRITVEAPSPTGDWGFAAEAFTGVVRILTDPAHPSALVVGAWPSVGTPPGLSDCALLVGEPCRPNRVPVPS